MAQNGGHIEVEDDSQPDSPSSNSTSDVFHDTASFSGRDHIDPGALEHESFFDAEDTSEAPAVDKQHEGASKALQEEHAELASSSKTQDQPQTEVEDVEEIPSAIALPSQEEQKAAAERHKKEGNELFATGQWEAAAEKYSEALNAAHEDEPSRAVYFANRAACRLKLRQLEEAAQDCTHATNIDQGYLKAWIRRSQAYEQLTQYERALTDAKKVVELDPGNTNAQESVRRLTPLAQQEQEKMKEEMIGKLKDLGNTVLGKFGMSLDNFNAVKDPNTGSYSINFKQ